MVSFPLRLALADNNSCPQSSRSTISEKRKRVFMLWSNAYEVKQILSEKCSG
jgi:hypothetical protein